MPIKKVIQSLAQSSLFPLEILWKGNLRGKQLALTFDDGPDPVHTPKLLQTLDEFKVVGTFFPIGEKARKYPDILKEIFRRGHELGNHSFSHNGFKVEAIKDFAYEIDQANRVVERIAGIKMRLLRPPFGQLSIPLFKYCFRKKMAIVMWSLDCLDSTEHSSLSLSSKIVRTAKENDILLMHDDGPLPASILRSEIPALIDRGFTFTNISNMLNS